MAELTKEQKTEIEILQSREELEALTDQQLILRALSSIIIKILPGTPYYYTMANVLRERGGGENKEKIWR